MIFSIVKKTRIEIRSLNPLSNVLYRTGFRGHDTYIYILLIYEYFFREIYVAAFFIIFFRLSSDSKSLTRGV